MQEVNDLFDYILEDCPQHLDMEYTTRLVQGLSLMGQRGNGITLMRCDDNLLKNLETADAYQFSSILRGFGRMYQGYSFGQDASFVKYEPKILKEINSFSPRQLSDIMYAYSIREQGNPELHKAF